MAEPKVKVELAAEIERARARMARSLGAVRRDLDVATHLKQSFRHNKVAYIGGATFFGLLLSKLPARRAKPAPDGKGKAGKVIKDAEKAGVWLVLLQFLFKTFSPALTSLVSKQVTEYVRSRAKGG
jgi:hypothetical protein